MSRTTPEPDALDREIREAFRRADLPTASPELRAQIESLPSSAQRVRGVAGGARFGWWPRSSALLGLVAAVAVVAIVVARLPILLTQSQGGHDSPGASNATPLASPSPTIATIPMTTLTPGLTAGPVPDPALKPSATFGCSWDGGFIVALADGRVLVAGGSCQPAEIYDPTTRTFHATGGMNRNRVSGTPTLLKDGRVLITGGRDPATSENLTTDEIYDPKTGRFTPIGPVRPRTGTASVLLQDGRVLIVGSDVDSTLPDTADIFDPATGTFTATGPLVGGRDDRSAVLLDDGRVLVVDIDAETVKTQLYDPATNSFQATLGQIDGFTPSANRLPDGRVMVFGSDFADAYNPSTGTFSSLASPSHLRDVMASTTLADGRILAIGPADDVSGPPYGWRPTSGALFDARPTASPENATTPYTLAGLIYDPARNVWTYLGHLNPERFFSVGVAPLPSGGAIVIGDQPGGSTVAEAELFDPKTGKFIVNN
jgi:hypothetical protein